MDESINKMWNRHTRKRWAQAATQMNFTGIRVTEKLGHKRQGLHDSTDMRWCVCVCVCVTNPCFETTEIKLPLSAGGTGTGRKCLRNPPSTASTVTRLSNLIGKLQVNANVFSQKSRYTQVKKTAKIDLQLLQACIHTMTNKI